MDSREKPGKRTLPVNEVVFELSSSLFFRYAAEPAPRSAVCRNQVGSFEAKECDIWSLDNSFSFSFTSKGVGPGVARGDLIALFSDAPIESGRLFALVEPLEVGRCCHESVPERDGIAALGVGLDLRPS